MRGWQGLVPIVPTARATPRSSFRFPRSSWTAVSSLRKFSKCISDRVNACSLRSVPLRSVLVLLGLPVRLVLGLVVVVPLLRPLQPNVIDLSGTLEKAGAYSAREGYPGSHRNPTAGIGAGAYEGKRGVKTWRDGA